MLEFSANPLNLNNKGETPIYLAREHPDVQLFLRDWILTNCSVASEESSDGDDPNPKTAQEHHNNIQESLGQVDVADADFDNPSLGPTAQNEENGDETHAQGSMVNKDDGFVNVSSWQSFSDIEPVGWMVVEDGSTPKSDN